MGIAGPADYVAGVVDPRRFAEAVQAAAAGEISESRWTQFVDPLAYVLDRAGGLSGVARNQALRLQCSPASKN
jgi:hypothetical protein